MDNITGISATTCTESVPVAAPVTKDTSHGSGPPSIPHVGVLHEAVEQESLFASKVMIIDDEKFNTLVAKKYLHSAGFENLVVCTEPANACEMIKAEKPDVILLDIVMPEVSGLDILRLRQQEQDLKFTPVIVLTASTSDDVKRAALELGASDFLAKPVDANDLIPRVRNSLLIKAHHDHLETYAEELNRLVLERTAELVRSREEIIHCLGRASEYRDNETGRHVVRVAQYCGLIAEELGLSSDFVERIRLSAQLHDIGKIGIRDDILLCPGQLDREQYDEMKSHCVIGREIITPTEDSQWAQLRAVDGKRVKNFKHIDSPLMEMASSIAYTHHEKWDGSGYPRGLAGEDIPIEGRITAVADVFDALSSERPYKKAFPLEKSVSIIHDGTGTHFDPKCVEAFFVRLDDVIRIQREFSDSFDD